MPGLRDDGGEPRPPYNSDSFRDLHYRFYRDPAEADAFDVGGFPLLKILSVCVPFQGGGLGETGRWFEVVGWSG